MVLDYRERKQVSKNRPKKRPVAMIALLVSGTVVAVYAVGIATGWFLHGTLKADQADSKPQAAAQVKQDEKKASSSSPVPQNQAERGTKNGDPALTFYYTLPKGEKMALGSGLNPPNSIKPMESVSKSPGSADANTGQNINIPERSPGSEKAAESTKAEGAKKGYTVQVASYDNRQDAEALQHSLNNNGLHAYVVDAQVPGKGTRFRVRLGNRLDLETANKLAAKIGRGAFVIPE